MARDSHMRERIFFPHSDPHGAAPFNGRFLIGMPDDDLLQRPIVMRGRRWRNFVARIKALKKRVPSYSNSKRPQRASASKANFSVLSQLSGLENVVFNDFINDELDSEDVSEQKASASMPDSVTIELEEERAASEADEMAALDAVGGYEADPNVMLEDVPQHIVIKTLKVSCACVSVLVFACVCVCVRARDVDMCS